MSWEDIIKGEGSLISKERTPTQALAMKLAKRIINEVETPTRQFKEQMRKTIKDIRNEIVESGISTYNLSMRMLLNDLDSQNIFSQKEQMMSNELREMLEKLTRE